MSYLLDPLSNLEVDVKHHIMIMIDHLGTGGAETHVLQLVQNLDQQKYHIHLVCLRHEGYRYGLVDQANVTKTVCGLDNITRLKPLLTTLIQLRRLVKSHDIKIIHAYIFNPIVVSTLLKLVAGGLFGKGVKLITTRRDTGFWHSPKHWAVYRLINRFADRIVCVCQAALEASMVHEHADREKMSVIYNGIDLAKLPMSQSLSLETRERYGIDDKTLLVGMVAIFRPEKRHDLYIAACLRVLEAYQGDVKFVVIGDGEAAIKQQMQQAIEQAGQADRFVFTGLLTDVKPETNMLDIVVLTSDFEAMSNAVVEAMAMGKPVVATQVGGNVELIEQGSTGLLFEKGSVEGLTKSLLQLLNDDQQRFDMGRKARQHAEAAFSLSVMIDRTDQTYQGLLGA